MIVSEGSGNYRDSQHELRRGQAETSRRGGRFSAHNSEQRSIKKAALGNGGFSLDGEIRDGHPVSAF